MLYTIISDENHKPLVWDSEQIQSLVGDIRSAMQKRIDMWHLPCSYKNVFSEPLRVSFPAIAKEYKGLPIPDICALKGRLFLNQKAYDALEKLLKHDGEFLPVVYEDGQGYVYTPLRVAEHVDGLNTELSKKSEWGDVENLAFHESAVKDWNVFRAEFNNYLTLQCQDVVKEAIETAGLKGLYITPDLGRIFACERGDVESLN